MPPLEHLDRYDTVTVWPATGYSDARGQPGYGNPAEHRVRYVPTSRIGQDAKGRAVTVSAVMTSPTLFPQESLVWRGFLADLPGTGSGFEGNPDQLMVVVGVREAADLKGRIVRRDYDLMRFTDRLPASAPRE